MLLRDFVVHVFLRGQASFSVCSLVQLPGGDGIERARVKSPGPLTGGIGGKRREIFASDAQLTQGGRQTSSAGQPVQSCCERVGPNPSGVKERRRSIDQARRKQSAIGDDQRPRTSQLPGQLTTAGERSVAKDHTSAEPIFAVEPAGLSCPR